MCGPPKPGRTVTAGFAARAELALEPAATAPIAALEELLTTASQLVSRPGGAGLVLFLDELHAAGRSELAILLNVLQNLDGNRANVPLAVFALPLFTARPPTMFVPALSVMNCAPGEARSLLSVRLMAYLKLFAVTGAPCPGLLDSGVAVTLGPGTELVLGTPREGLRSYLAVRGGIDVEPVLGSRSTDTLSGLGPARLSFPRVVGVPRRVSAHITAKR